MKIDESDKIDITETTEKKSVNEILNDISETKKFQKNCPKCGCIRFYKNLRSLKDSIRYNWKCKVCGDVVRKETTIKKHLHDKFQRNCPTCNQTLHYKNSFQLNRANTKNSKCKRCVFKNRPISEKQKEFLRNSRIGCNNPMYGKKLSLTTRLKMSLIRKGKPGKPLSESAKQKLRLYRANWVNEFAGGPQYNPTACKYFDELNKQNGWNLQHAENGGEYYVKELGYFLDAYDKQRNIVIEYDEPKHFTIEGNLKEKDIKRQEQITSLLKCKFLRYNELTKNLKSTGEISVH